MTPRLRLIAYGIFAVVFAGGCHSVDDDRIPAYAVSINLGDAASWNTYGVSGFGSSRRFILSPSLREPRGFPYSQQSATGFGECC